MEKRSKDKKKRFFTGRRMLAVLLAVCTVLTLPVFYHINTLFAQADTRIEVGKQGETDFSGRDQEQQPPTESDNQPNENTPQLNIQWGQNMENTQVSTGSSVEIALEAELAEAGETSADVAIQLSKQEAAALKTFQEQETVMTQEGREITLRTTKEGAELCFTLDKTHNNLSCNLIFQAPNGLTAPFTIEVSQQDVAATFHGDEEQTPTLKVKSNPIGYNADFSWDIAVSAPQEETTWQEENVPGFNFAVQAVSNNRQETGDIFTQKQVAQIVITLPAGLSWQTEEITYDAQRGKLLQGELELATLTGIPQDAQVTAVNAEGKSIQLDVLRQVEQNEPSEELLPDLNIEIVLHGMAMSLENRVLQEGSIEVKTMATSTPINNGVEEHTGEDEAQVLLKVPQPQQPAQPIQSRPEYPSVNSLNSPLEQDEKQNQRLEEEETITIDAYREALTQTIFWVDNNDEDSARPNPSEFAPKLYFSIDGGAKILLTDQTKNQIGMDAVPVPTVAERGVGTYYYSIGGNTLPSKMICTDSYGDITQHEITWSIESPEVEKYAFVNVDRVEDYPSISRLGWYYVLQTDVSFDVKLRWGSMGSAPGISDAIFKNFNLVVKTSQEMREYTLEELKDAIEISREPSQDPDNPTSGSITIHNTWKYNLDGTAMHFTVEKNSDAKITIDSLDEGDYFAPSYDNSAAPNFGSIVDKVHPGGTLILTLTGTKEYVSSKVWLDEGTKEAIASRPTGEFQLWRYREGNGFSTASPVRNSDGSIVAVVLDTDPQGNTQIVKFNVDGSTQLPKYDAEGYEYLYVAREYLDSETVSGEEAGQYEQVFGSIDEEGQITDRVDVDGELVDTKDPALREDTNTFLYNGGTLSNRIVGDVQTSATKTWKAAAFQAAFGDVTVELTLQTREKGSDDPWQDTSITVTMDDFSSEFLADTITRSASRYDIYGQELEHRWVESGVFQGKGSKENLLTREESGGGTFTLIQDGREIRYKSTVEIAADGTSQITNTIENTIIYEITKRWLDEEGEDTTPPQGIAASFVIYRSNHSGVLESLPIAWCTVDGVVDDEATVIDKELGISVQETAPWKVTVFGLQEYDDEGYQYEYMMLEAEGGQNWVPIYSTERLEDGYHSVVINAPGENNIIMVRKQWVDDSDILHREPVTISVYAREDDHLIASVVLKDDVWNDWVSIGAYRPEEVYILETKMGGTPVPLTYGQEGQEPNYDIPDAPTQETAIQFTTQYHKYEVTYQSENINGTLMYVARNRRLGNVDLTVQKSWLDGEGSYRTKIQKAIENLPAEKKLSPALYLEFRNAEGETGYSISRNGLGQPDTIIVGNLPVSIQDNKGGRASSIQKLDLTAPGKEYYFYGLPKYDGNGKVVNYWVQEVWVDSSGNIVSLEQMSQDDGYKALYELISEYRVSIEQTSYEVGDHYDEDNQDILVTNTLTGSKDVAWYKQWEDDYNYHNNLRPDIYLNIYQTVHQSSNPNDTVTSLYRANYKWTYRADADLDGQYDKQWHWIAVMEDLPKYDAFGYEIMYYATEHTTVNSKNFDYLDVQYAVGSLPNIRDIGTEFTITDPTDLVYVEDIGQLEPVTGHDVHYALMEGGTFTNQIAQSVVIQGRKLWNNMPTGYPNVDLPEVTFTLYQKLQSQGDEALTPVATLTVNQWADVAQSGSYLFQIEYMGKNTMNVDKQTGQITVSGEPNAPKLPKYDERGELYTYELQEAIFSGPEPDDSLVYHDPIVNTYLITNSYDSVKGALSVKKYLQLPLDWGNNPTAYPAVTFELTRQYTKEDGSLSEAQRITSLTWSSEEVKAAYDPASSPAGLVEKVFTFEDLDIYAPNGNKYIYTVTEVKTYLNGYNTWAGSGELALDALKKDKNIAVSVSNLKITENQDGGTGDTANDVAIAATFANEKVPVPETIPLTGEKRWNDYNDLFGLRPEKIGIELYRYADSQPGQNNAIPEEKLVGAAAEWENTDTGVWTYTFGDFEKYAPNGMLWKYVVKETPVSPYVISPSSGRVTEAERTDDLITMNPLTNSLTRSVPFSKSWVDSDGNIIDEDYLGMELTVEFKLQVGEANTSGQVSQWQDASAYFASALGANYDQVFSADYLFTQTKTGRIDDASIWGINHYFAGLPRVIVKEGQTSDDAVRLNYRVIETKISYGAVEQNVRIQENGQGANTYVYVFGAGLFSPAYWANGRNADETTYNYDHTRNLYNCLETTDLTIAKTWAGDGDNIYGTRPDTGRTNSD